MLDGEKVGHFFGYDVVKQFKRGRSNLRYTVKYRKF